MEAPRSSLAGHYRFAGALEPARDRLAWVALDERTGKPVVAQAVGADRISALSALRDQKHPHLATVLAVVVDPDPDHLPGGGPLDAGAGVVVAELVRGRTLHEQLAQDGALLAFKSVAWLLRLISAVQFLHERGLVHGAISPRSIVIEPKGRLIAPVISHFVAPAVGGYVSPEHLKGAPVAVEDDVWALHATCYAMLAGVAPFTGDTRDSLVRHVLAGSARPLSDFGVDDAALQSLLSGGLHPNARQRAIDLPHLASALDAWERGIDPPAPPLPSGVPRTVPPGTDAAATDDIVFDDTTLPDDNGVPQIPEPVSTRAASWAPPREPAVSASEPGAPPVAPASEPAPASRPAPPPFATLSRSAPAEAHRSRWPLAVLGAAVVAGGVAAAYLTLGGEPDSSPSPTRVAPPRVAATPEAKPDPEELRRKLMSPAALRAECIRSYFPEKAFPEQPKLEFVCSDEPFPGVVRQLYAVADPEAGVEADAGAPAAAPAVLDGGGLVVRAISRRLLPELQWYELLTTAIIRQACCAQAGLVKLPATRGECRQLQGIVREIADASQKGVDVSHATKQFDDAINCLFVNQVEFTYTYREKPADTHRRAFQKFLQRAAELEAKRTKGRR